MRKLLDLVPDLLFIVEESGNVLLMNRSGQDFLEAPSVDINGQPLIKWVHQEDRPQVIRSFADDEQTGPVETRFVSESGQVRYTQLALSAGTDNGQPIVYGFGRDIGEQRRSEANHRKERDRAHRYLSIAGGILVVIDSSQRVTLINRSGCAILGYDENDIIGKNWFDCFVPEQLREQVRKVFEELISGKIAPVEYFGNAIVTSSGHERTIAWHNTVLTESDGSISGTISSGTDITERIQIEEALKKSEIRYRDLVDLLPQIVFEMDRAGNLTFVNRQALQSFGYGEDELAKDMHAYDFLVPEERERAIANIRRSLIGEKIDDNSYTAIRKDGSTFPVEIFSSPVVENDEPAGLRGIMLDITDRKKLQEDTLKSEKLEALGILAGGIAHDFNNLLMAILGSISLANIKMQSEGELTEILSDAEKAARQAADLTQQLLTFSKIESPRKKMISLGELVIETTTFVLRGTGVSCKLSVPDDLWAINADRGQINQVVSNILINACQAMPDGGVVDMTCVNLTTESSPTLHMKFGSYVDLCIEDHGVGISKTDLRRIFDPYFTTKEQGTGLGLATSYSIIKQHDGYITVDSKLGKGSTFHVYLPASPHKEAGRAKGEGGVEVGQGKILVMDDEEIVRKSLGRMLSHLGYFVSYSQDGVEAIRLYREAREKSEPFDLVIMDLTVPGGMGGKEAIHGFREIDPEVKAIVSSGYSTDSVMTEPEAYGFRGVIPKPFTIKELGHILREVMSPGPSG